MSDVQQLTPLRELTHRDRMSTQEALELFDTLPPVEIEHVIGRWRGSEIFTHHPLNGLLEVTGWYGKEFIDAEHVYPLLFSDTHGRLFALNPRWIPYKLALYLPIPRIRLLRRVLLAGRFVVQTRKAKARVRMMEYRGKVSASMLYDNLPIYDTFRLIDQDTLLGVMDCKGVEQPFFFRLHRDV